MTEPLRTRQPTGQVAFPLVLVEGEEKAGKTYAALALSASDRVGRTFVLELDEPTADEYAALGAFEILEHNGTFTDVLGQLEAACALPAEAGRPNVIILDSATALWDLLKGWVDQRARNSRGGQVKLRQDPDAEIDASMNLWNDAKERWNRVMNLLRLWPGIAIVVARGREVAKVVNGQPVAGETEWRVDAEKSTTFAVSAWVRMTRPHKATLIAARSLHVDVPQGGLTLPEVGPLEHLIFDVLGAGGHFQPSSAIVPQQGVSAAVAKQRLIDYIAANFEIPPDTIKATAAELWSAHPLPAELTEEQWFELIDRVDARLGEKRKAA